MKKLSKEQSKDLQECNELAGQGKGKDCFGCSCNACLANYAPLSIELDELKAKIKEVEGQLAEVLEESTKLQNEAIRLALDYERTKNERDTLRQVLGDARDRVKALQQVKALEAVAEAARDCVNMVLVNMHYSDKMSEPTKKLVKAMAALDGDPQ